MRVLKKRIVLGLVVCLADCVSLCGLSVPRAHAVGRRGVGSMTTARFLHTTTLLTDGHVRVGGGVGSSVALSCVERIDPATTTWSAVAFPKEP